MLCQIVGIQMGTNCAQLISDLFYTVLNLNLLLNITNII